MARSLKKGPYIEAKLETKVLSMTEGKLKKGVIDVTPPGHCQKN